MWSRQFDTHDNKRRMGNCMLCVFVTFFIIMILIGTGIFVNERDMKKYDAQTSCLVVKSELVRYSCSQRNDTSLDLYYTTSRKPSYLSNKRHESYAKLNGTRITHWRNHVQRLFPCYHVKWSVQFNDSTTLLISISRFATIQPSTGYQTRSQA